MLVYFGFTFCPDICPAELAKVTKTLKILGNPLALSPPSPPLTTCQFSFSFPPPTPLDVLVVVPTAEEEGITPGLVVPVFISVDPYRDTVGKIRSYLKGASVVTLK
jgi:hypothetical protein